MKLDVGSSTPPIRWILVTAFLLTSFSLMHLMHNADNIANTNNNSHLNKLRSISAVSYNEKIDLLINNAKDYTNSLETELIKLENKIINKNDVTETNSNVNNKISSIDSNNNGLKLARHSIDINNNIDLNNKLLNGDQTRVSLLSNHINTNTESVMDNKATKLWYDQLLVKLRCLHGHLGGIYLYHVRKAAGTTVREVLELVSKVWKVALFETEGITLDERFLATKGLFTIMSIRQPIDRILSLYWYEHVAWYVSITKEPEKCKSLKDWVNAWKDGTEWKTNFILANPKNVYVEIENYYVKILSGWIGPDPVSKKHLDKAKEVLDGFDLVLLTEWMKDETQINAFNALFSGRSGIAAANALKGDKKIKEQYGDTLGKDLVSTVNFLIKLLLFHHYIN
jgi:hypothetical protein